MRRSWKVLSLGVLSGVLFSCNGVMEGATDDPATSSVALVAPCLLPGSDCLLGLNQVTLPATSMTRDHCSRVDNGLVDMTCDGSLVGSLHLPYPGPTQVSVTMEGAAATGPIRVNVSVDGVAVGQLSFAAAYLETKSLPITPSTILKTGVILAKPGVHAVRLDFPLIPPNAIPVRVSGVALTYESPLAVPTTLKGGLMEATSQGALVSTLAGEVWAIQESGTVQESVRFPTAGSYHFVVTAGGTFGDGGWPTLQFEVDGKLIGSAPVAPLFGGQFGSFAYDVELVQGLHTVAVTFPNGVTGSTRTLMVNTVGISMTPSAPFNEAVCVSEGVPMVSGASLQYDAIVSNDGKGNRSISVSYRATGTSKATVATYTGGTRTDFSNARVYGATGAMMTLTPSTTQGQTTGRLMLDSPLLGTAVNDDTLHCFVSPHEEATAVTTCQDISAPGNYTLTTNLNEPIPLAAACINIHDTTDVQLDCQGKSIVGVMPVNLSKVSRISLTRCNLQASGEADGAFPNQVFGATQVNTAFVVRNQMGNTGQGANYYSINAQIDSSRFAGNVINAEMTNEYVTNSFYDDNVFVSPNTEVQANNMGLTYGSHNRIAFNWMDGRWNRTTMDQSYGTDDNIDEQDEDSDLVMENDLVNAWDCGYETTGVLKNTIIASNRMVGVNWAVCGWYWSNWISNTVSDNVATGSTDFFVFNRIFGLRPAGFDDLKKMPADLGVYFQNNTFSGNRMVSPSLVSDPSRGGWMPIFSGVDFWNGTISGSFPGETKPTASQMHLTGNVFKNNDFSHQIYAPYFGPNASDATNLIIDGGGNSCGTIEDGQTHYPLVCH